MALTNLQANITLDVYDHDGAKPSIKTIALDDNTRYVLANIRSRGEVYDIGSSATVQLIVIRPDKVGVQIAGQAQGIEIGQEDESVVTVYGAYAELDQAAIVLPGTLLGQFKITSGDQILRTQIFQILNGEALDSDTWAGDYDGYNLEEMATSIETNTADIATLEADVSQIKEDLQDINNDVYVAETVWTSIPLTFEVGKYWSLTGTDSAYTNARRSTDVIQVTAGEKIKISTRISINIAGVIYFNDLPFSKSNFVSYDLYDIPEGVTTRTYLDEEVTVPEGASYVVVQGRGGTSVVFDLKKQNEEYTPKTDILGEEVDAYISSNDFEVKNLERRATNAESRNPFAWSAFDKSYFVFIHDDTNEHLETYASVFHEKSVPMGAATIPAYITETHLATLQQIVADGGEVLGHYNASPTESSSDATWMSCTGDVKKALEAYGFEVHGLIKANSTASSTNKGQKFCQRYYDYADNHLGKTEQYNFPRTLMLNYDSLSAFKARIDALENVNGIHAFGFHGGREDEAWITPEAFSEIIDYIQAKTNCEITTYYNLWQTFGSSVLAERIKALES